MIVTHPFDDFVPRGTHYLLLGSFVATPGNNYDWYYSNGRNYFWPILERVYKRRLSTKNTKQELFSQLNLAVTDVINSCERINKNSSLDNNLTNIVYNKTGIERIIKNNKIKKIFFTSHFVETTFKKVWSNLIEENPHIELIYLPSPSPRYAKMTIGEKIKIYKKLLPRFK